MFENQPFSQTQTQEQTGQASTSHIYHPQRGFVDDFPMQMEKKEIRAHTRVIAIFLLLSLALRSFLTIPMFFMMLSLGLGRIQNGSIVLSAELSQVVSLLKYSITMLVPIVLIPLVLKNIKQLKTIFREPNRRGFGSALMITLAVSAACSFALTLLKDQLASIGVIVKLPYISFQSSALQCILSAATIVIVTPILEELLFRGVILHSLRKFSDPFAVVVSSLLFALAHQNLVQAVIAFVFGCTVAYFVIKTNSWITGMLLHIANNFISFLNLTTAEILTAGSYQVLWTTVYIVLLFVGVFAAVSMLNRDKKAFSLYKKPSYFSDMAKFRIAICTVPMLVLLIVYVLDMLYTITA